MEIMDKNKEDYKNVNNRQENHSRIRWDVFFLMIVAIVISIANLVADKDNSQMGAMIFAFCGGLGIYEYRINKKVGTLAIAILSLSISALDIYTYLSGIF